MTTPATSCWPRTETDPQRLAILAAADRILAGTPARSTGRASVVQLALEAEVKYWVVAQKHTDLRDHFQGLAAHAEAARPADGPWPVPAQPSEVERLTRRCSELEDLVATYAQVINELSAENRALRAQRSSGPGIVTPLRRRRLETT